MSAGGILLTFSIVCISASVIIALLFRFSSHGPAETEFELDLIETETAPPPLQNRADPDEDDMIIELDELDLEDDDMTFS